jgi:hypothetical protein
MGISRSAYFLSKALVELPRIAILTLALLSTFYPMASPRCPFLIYFCICFAAAFAVTGFAYIFSIAQDPKSAQLSVVVFMVVFWYAISAHSRRPPDLNSSTFHRFPLLLLLAVCSVAWLRSCRKSTAWVQWRRAWRG